MTDLTEKNLEAVLLNLTKTDKPITLKPTTWFGNPAKTAQWYTCPNCSKQSPLTLEWVGLTDEEVDEIYTSVQEEVNRHWDKGGTTMMFPFTLYKAIEKALKERNT